jgi:hypothetical protein
VDPDPFDTDPDHVFHFNTVPDPAFQFDLDPDLTVWSGSLTFQRGNVPKTVLFIRYILTWFSLSVGPIGPNQKTYRYFVKFSLPVNFVVPIWVAYRSWSYNTGERIRILEHDMDPYGSGSAILYLNALVKMLGIFISLVGGGWLGHMPGPGGLSRHRGLPGEASASVQAYRQLTETTSSLDLTRMVKERGPRRRTA